MQVILELGNRDLMMRFSVGYVGWVCGGVMQLKQVGIPTFQIFFDTADYIM